MISLREAVKWEEAKPSFCICKTTKPNQLKSYVPVSASKTFGK